MLNKSENKFPEMQVIRRDVIPALTSVIVNGETHSIGRLLEFRKNPVLSTFIPENTRLSVAWVNLKKDETLGTHQHPTSSMIIICEGEGEVVGDFQQKVNAGDIVVVPPNNVHGFIGRGKNGLWGLSIQFEGPGLYEDRDSPRVNFVGSKTKETTLDRLLREQHEYEKQFNKTPLMLLPKSESISNPIVKERLLEALNYWSDWFQRILAARYAQGGRPDFIEIAGQHLGEEFGHNKTLYSMRSNAPVTWWDPLLDAAASWFYCQMISGTDEEKTILIHFVLEGASTLFHTIATPIFPKAEHFELHSVLDEDHFQMGCDLIKNNQNVDADHLSLVLKRGWDEFNVIATQMANYALKGSAPKQKTKK